MRRYLAFLFAVTSIATASPSSAGPVFINGIVISGSRLDATRIPGANGGRFGFFSDIYYDPARNEWWALSDRGPGGGLIDYGTRVQRFTIDVNPLTGAISHFHIVETVTFTDPRGLLTGASPELNGLNPLDLNGFEGTLGRSFDPEGLVIDPRTGHFLVADE
jgi:Esterase-like activity of phytase